MVAILVIGMGADGSAHAQPGPIAALWDSCDIPPKGDFVSLSGGLNVVHFVGIRTDGSLAQWGAPAFVSVYPAPAGEYARVASGLGFSIAIRAEEGTLVGWGINQHQQIDVPPGVFVDVSCGKAFSIALAADGTLHGWGHEYYPGPPIFGWLTKPPSGKYKAVACGYYHAVAIAEDGSLVGWGWYDGFIKYGPPGGEYKAVAASFLNTYALRTDGTLVVFGNDTIAPKTGKYTAISATVTTKTALRDDGAVVFWGSSEAYSYPGTYSAVAAGSSGPVAISTTPLCPGDFNADAYQNINDFICFQTLYAIGDPKADCDQSGGLDIDDFICFQTAYAIGC